MFPSGKKKRRSSEKSHGPAKKRKLSPGQSLKDRGSKSPEGQHRNQTGKKQQKEGWKKSRDGEKSFGKKMKPTGKAFGAKRAGEQDRFGGKRRNGDRPFKSKSQKGKMGFNKSAGGRKQGFKHKQRKGKGWPSVLPFKLDLEKFSVSNRKRWKVI